MEQKESPALKPHPSKLIVETTTRCNLQCPMCLKNTCRDHFDEADMTMETFTALVPAFPFIDALVLNGIGEPLLHPRLEEFIRLAKRYMHEKSWVGFQSNGLLLDAKCADTLIDAGLDRICFSIDAVDPEGFRLIRRGGELEGVEKALQTLRSARIRHHATLEIGIEFVLRQDNLGELPATLHWAGQHGVDFAMVSQLFPYHPDLVDQAVYDANLDASVSIFRKYKQLAEKRGLDLRRYRNVYMHYAASEEDLRVKDLIEAMMAEALDQGISMNIDKLLIMNPSWAEQTAEVFEVAREAAARWGIDLRLPGIIPRSTRLCEFVEEGCAFLSVDGGIHPCYFLWHRYRCYINGIEKAVGPKRFGNIPEQDILELWNDPSYVSFRRNVLKYDYPFCFNCSFALCDYVQGEDFEQDCYINSEPCAVCLWCMDMFQCLK